MILKAQPEDFKAIILLYQSSIHAMRAQGLLQWQWGVYPDEQMLQKDMNAGQLYVYKKAGNLLAAFVLNRYHDPEYTLVRWQIGLKPMMLHRLVVHPDYQGQGIAKLIMGWILENIPLMGGDCLRLDTSSLNSRALKLYDGLGMHRAGKVYFNFATTPFICFEMPVTADCPLLPIIMTPAYRHGNQTPWGGTRLKELFDKDIPDDHTGESLEVSAIPGLNSRDSNGEILQSLIDRYEEKLVGRYAHGPFPLLLKLLDARETLSVQVHPDDEYAAQNENGKLGKTEAWVILDCPPESQMVYGILPGTTKEQLHSASLQGEGVEKLLRRVPVKPGDVLMIAAGCVHAISEGITLYEIQQSSDITYRFYDWNRTDSQGQKRDLHIDKALDVANLDFQGDVLSVQPRSGVTPLLNEQYFTLTRIQCSGFAQVPQTSGTFQILTALDSLILAWNGGLTALKKGQTALLPACCPELCLKGVGTAILAAPN